jgi:hypothetical protein
MSVLVAGFKENLRDEQYLFFLCSQVIYTSYLLICGFIDLLKYSEVHYY